MCMYVTISRKILFIFIFVFVSKTSASDVKSEIIHKIVETNSGPLRGKLVKTLYEEKPYFSFKGIPYAEKPLGNLRFKAPVPKSRWTETIDAFEHANVCLQRTAVYLNKKIGNEDCLYLNVYTPDVNPSTKLPVMFFMHGGYFYEGSGNDDFFGPDFLINENVVLVTINYRLNIFGFLSLNTPEYSGNMGLKDQHLALQWVNQNIDKFGGDPSQITVFGHSAGSASVHYQLLGTPFRNQLFQRAIFMSGVALNEWSLYQGRDHTAIVGEMAHEMGYSFSNITEMIIFLYEASGDDILGHVKEVPSELDKNYKLDWLPLIEEEQFIEPFLTKTPTEIYNESFSTDIDVMFGYTKDEWLVVLSMYEKDPELLEPFDKEFQIPLPFQDFNKYIGTEEYINLMAEIRNHYFGEGVAINNSTLNELCTLMSHTSITYEVEKTIQLQGTVSTANTFYYRFSVDSAFNGIKLALNTTLPGASHGDELCYIFRCNIFNHLYNESAPDSIQVRAVRNIAKLWANFAKYGNPTPNGQPVDFQAILADKINMLDINNNGLETMISPNKEMVHFWDNLKEKYQKIFQVKESARNK